MQSLVNDCVRVLCLTQQQALLYAAWPHVRLCTRPVETMETQPGGPSTCLLAGSDESHRERSPHAQITLTVLAAYGAYTISDELLDLSGVLACVALGLWVAAKGRHRISSSVVEPMLTVWCGRHQQEAGWSKLRHLTPHAQRA